MPAHAIQNSGSRLSTLAKLFVEGYATRLRLGRGQLEVDWLGSTELEERISRPRGPSHERIQAGDREAIVLTGQTAEMQQFLLDSLNQPDAFESRACLDCSAPIELARYLSERSRSQISTRPDRTSGGYSLEDGPSPALPATDVGWIALDLDVMQSKVQV